MKIVSLLVCISFLIVSQNAFGAAMSEEPAAVSIKRTVQLLIEADDAINKEVDDCLKSALKSNQALTLQNYQPDLVVRILARQVQSELKDPTIILSMVVIEPFNNVAVIKHWASGFRQAFPYGATIALKNSTQGLVRYKNHQVESAHKSKLRLLCENIIKNI